MGSLQIMLLPLVIADRGPTKFGRATPGSFIPVVSEEVSRAQGADLYMLCRGLSAIRGKSPTCKVAGKLVFPLPEFEIVSSN